MTQNRHSVERVRHELKRRELIVRRVRRLTPQMLRVTLAGEALQGFVSAAPDDHVKVFFPGSGGEPAARDYTPRRYDAQSLELDLDFVLHGDGPAAQWAASAQPGQRLVIGGPRGSFVVSDDFDWYLLLGDETALPAIGRRLEELRAATRVQVIIEVADAAEQQPLHSRARLEVTWLHRGAGEPGQAEPLVGALSALSLPPGEGYAWIAGESQVARALREHLVHQRGLSKSCVKAAGYWKRGAVATHETHND